jgi:uncharacterized protein (TIGR00251 family)
LSDFVLQVKVIPGARRDEIVGFRNGEIVIKVSAPPEKGKANEKVLELLSSCLQIPKSQLILFRGVSSPHKKIRIIGASKDEVLACFG